MPQSLRTWLTLALLLHCSCQQTCPYEVADLSADAEGGPADGRPGPDSLPKLDGSSLAQLAVSHGFKPGEVQPLAPIGDDYNIDTNTCLGAGVASDALIAGTLRQGEGEQQACVITLVQLTLAEGATLRITGDYPLVLIVTGEVDLQGAVELAATGLTPGPGGFRGGLPTGNVSGNPGDGPGGGTVSSCSGYWPSGGGGAAHGRKGTEGGRIGNCLAVPVAAAYNELPAPQLLGGSGGAAADRFYQAGGGEGGGGGGALQISSAGQILLNSTIHAGGGGGRGGLNTGNYSSGGGGGGSGGTVLLEAPSISGSGLVAANGGAGAAGSGSQCTSPAPDGQDSAAALQQAEGGQASILCGSGGAGGTGIAAAESGKNASADTAAAGSGGGGGEVGRIHFRWIGHTNTPPVNASGLVTTSEHPGAS